MSKIYPFKALLLTLTITLLSAFVVVAQDVTATPSSINFGAVEVGQQLEIMFDLTNNTAMPIELTQFVLNGMDASQFSSINQFETIDPGATISLPLTFQPSSEGEKTAQYDIGNFETQVLVSIPLTAFGGTQQEPIMTVEDLNFPATDIVDSNTQTMTISNSGTIDLEITNMVFTSVYDDFSFANTLNYPIIIPVDTSMDFSVVFAPQPGNNSTGRPGNLEITSNDNDPFNENVNQDSSVDLLGSVILGSLEPTIASIEFGSQTVGSVTTMNLSLQNTGSGTVAITETTFEVGGSNPDATNEFYFNPSLTLPVFIPPNTTLEVPVAFSPNDVDFRSDDVEIVTANNENSETFFFNVDLRGNGIVANFVGPASIDFGSLDPDDQEVQENFTILNTGAGDLELSTGVITGEHASDFYFNTPNNAVTISPSTSFSPQLEFNPSGLGARTATLTYTSNDPDSPHTIDLNGFGEDVFIELSTNTIDFGNTNGGESSQQTLVITNPSQSTGDLTITNIALTGDTTDYSFGNVTLPLVLSPGENMSLPITFLPTSSGGRLADLQITSNDDNSPAIVALSGIGIQGVVTLNRMIVEFQDTQSVTGNRNELLRVTNNGNAPLEITELNFTGPDASAFSVEGVTLPFTLAIGANRTFPITFRPQSRTLKTASLAVVSANSGTGSVALMGQGLGPKFTSGGAVNFGGLNLNETKSATVIIRNTGESALQVTNMSLGGTNPASFGFDASGLPFSLAPGASQTIPVTVSPTVSGVISAQLQFTTNDVATVNPNVALSASVTDRPTITFASNPFVFPTTNAGEVTFSLIPVTNTGSREVTIISNYVFASDNASIFPLNQYEDGSDIFPMTLQPGESGNLRFRFGPDGELDSYSTTAAVVTAVADGPTTNFDFNCGSCGGFVHRFETAGGSNRPILTLEESVDENGNEVQIELPNVSIGRTGERIINVTNTGTLEFSLFGSLFSATGDFDITYADPDSGDVTLQPGESVELRVTFSPQGDVGQRDGLITIRSSISNPPFGFTDHQFIVTALAVEPEEVAVGGLVFEADNRTLQDDGVTWLMQGNVHAGKLEYSGDILVNTAEMTVVSVEEIDVFITDVPEVGDFGGERVLLQSGMVNQTVDNTNPIINATVGGAAAGVDGFFTLIGLPVSISSFTLIDETVDGVRKRGIEMGGALELPPEIFGDDANITFDRIRIDDVDGVNVMGSAEIAPELQILSTFQLTDAAVEFDTFTNSFSGSAGLKISLVNKDVTIDASIAIINGGLDSVELEIEVDPGIPIASTGFSLAGGNGFLRGLQEGPVSLGLGVDIVPTVSAIDLRLDNFTVAYTFGTSLSASGNVQLYNEDIGGGSVTISVRGVSVSAFANLYDVFKGNVSMLVENRTNPETNMDFLFFEATANMSVTIPSVEVTFGCIACEAVNNFLPLTVAEIDATFNNTTIRGSLTVAEVLELAVAISKQPDNSYKTNFNANIGPLNLSFFNGQNPNSFNSNFSFENNLDLQANTFGLEGRSLLFEGNGTSSFAPMDVPFTLNDTYRNIIVRVREANSTPNFTLILPDNTEITPANAEDFGYLATRYEEDNKAFYILQNTPTGEYKIRVDDGGTYEFDILGAEFAPELNITSVTGNAANDTVDFTWTDQDLDSDASIAFYYDTDNKGGNGQLIVEGISENDNTDAFTFDTSALKNGTYFIYGIINDDTNEEDGPQRAPVISYGITPFVIDRTTTVEATTLFGELDDDIFELSWSPIDDVEYYSVYIAEDDLSLESPNQNVGDRTSFDFKDISPGRIYDFAVTAIRINTEGLYEESPLSNIVNFQYISDEENNIPRITTESLPNYTDACTEYQQTITSTDPDAEDTLTLSLAIAPEGMTLSGNTITWQPTVEQLGQNQVVFEVNDGNGGIVQKQLIIAVLEADGDAPTPDIETLADVVEECSATLTAPTATDDCSGSITATTDDDTTFSEQGTYQVTWTYTDDNGNDVEQIQNVTIEDTTAPDFDESTLPADTTREANLNNEYSLEDFKNDVTFVENCSATIAQNPAVGTVFTPGTYNITLTVTDVANQTDVHTFELEVLENSLGVDDINTQEFNLYPNPTERFIMINNPNNEVITSVEVYDLNGKVVKRMIPSTSINDIEVDTSSLQTGMYLMKINTDAAQTVKTFLKE